MSKYNLSKEMPWKHILQIQRWHIMMKMNSCIRYANGLAKGWNEFTQDGLENEQGRLRESCESYRALRAFLCRTSITALEKRAWHLLENGANE